MTHRCHYIIIIKITFTLITENIANFVLIPQAGKMRKSAAQYSLFYETKHILLLISVLPCTVRLGAAMKR